MSTHYSDRDLTNIPVKEGYVYLVQTRNGLLIDGLGNSIESVLVGVTASMATTLNASNNLITYVNSEAFEFTNIAYDNNGLILSGSIKWPDSTTGSYYTDSVNNDFLVVQAYHITYPNNNKIITQQTMSFNEMGQVIKKPDLTVI